MPPPNPNAGPDAGQHQLRLGTERQRGADLGVSLRLARRHDGRHAAAAVLAGAYPAQRCTRRNPHDARLARRSYRRFRPLRFALRELRGGLHGFRIFIACIALGVMAIAGVGSFSRSLTDGLAREGRVILGGDLSFSADPPRGRRRRTPLPRRPRPGLGRRHHARDGAHRRRPPRAGRAQGRRRRLSAVRHGRRSIPTCRSTARWSSATARSAPRSIRRCWRGSISSPARASPSATATIEITRRHQDRARQARQRHRLRPARHRQRGGAARHRPAGARQPGALALPPAACRRQRPRRAGRHRRPPRRNCRTPAGRSAPATTLRRRSSATSSASPSS